MSADSKSAKKTDSLTVFFALLGSAHIKASCSYEFLEHVVNFTNILRTAFSSLFLPKNYKAKLKEEKSCTFAQNFCFRFPFAKKLLTPIVKLQKTLSNKRAAHKMLMNLTSCLFFFYFQESKEKTSH
jgi:hypothetical protein